MPGWRTILLGETLPILSFLPVIFTEQTSAGHPVRFFAEQRAIRRGALRHFIRLLSKHDGFFFVEFAQGPPVGGRFRRVKVQRFRRGAASLKAERRDHDRNEQSYRSVEHEWTFRHHIGSGLLGRMVISPSSVVFAALRSSAACRAYELAIVGPAMLSPSPVDVLEECNMISHCSGCYYFKNGHKIRSTITSDRVRTVRPVRNRALQGLG